MRRHHLETPGWALFLLLFLVTMPGATLLQPAQAQGPWVYEEDFQGGRADGWELRQDGDNAAWQIIQDGETENRILHGFGHVFADYVADEWDNYRLQCRVRLESPEPIHLNYRTSTIST
jgi:hypothetical protein